MVEEFYPKVYLKNNYYSVNEDDGIIEVCAHVTTDEFDHTVNCDYLTTAGSAAGKILDAMSALPTLLM